MGGSEAAAGEAILNRAQIPTYAYPDRAAQAFATMWRYSDNVHALYETPVLRPPDHPGAWERRRIAALLSGVREAGRTLLTEVESKQVLAAYAIPTVETRTAQSADDAVHVADALGYPVVLKLLSQTITHKTDVGGVALNLADAAAVRRAYREIAASVAARAGAEHVLGVSVQPMIAYHGYELILGSSIDPQFGPVLLFGSGGQLVEVFHDRALALPPLNSTLARRMMEQTRIYTALKGVRGRQPVDLAALEQLLVCFSHLVVEQPWIKEIDINPLLASPEGLVALDARIVVHGRAVQADDLPQPAIRPYPAQYVTPWVLKDGTHVTLRPIRAEDEPLMVTFHRKLSADSVYARYFHLMKLDERVAHDRLTRICFIDYDRELALVAERQDPRTSEREILGVGRLSKLHGLPEAEFAVVVADPVQGKGLGTALLRRLIQIARNEKLQCIRAEILPQNRRMQSLCRKLGFQLRFALDDDVVRAQLVL
jgi:acetyltransferase